MTTKVEKSIQVDVPVSTAYAQWTQFEEFPQFMSGVTSVTQLDDTRMHWVAEIGGVRREWDARVVEQVPDQKVAWAATSGATNAGAVYFAPSGASSTMVRLELEYEPEGIVEKAGDALGIVGRQAQNDLERFKSFIEGRGSATGGWHGEVNAGAAVGTPGVEDAAASQGDSGKAGVTPAAVVAGVAAAAAAAVGVAAAVKSGSDDSDSSTDTHELQGDAAPSDTSALRTDTGLGSSTTTTSTASTSYTDADADIAAVEPEAGSGYDTSATGERIGGVGSLGVGLGTGVVAGGAAGGTAVTASGVDDGADAYTAGETGVPDTGGAYGGTTASDDPDDPSRIR